MKVYTVRKALTNANTATTKGEGMSRWATYAEASKEVNRLYAETGIECFITTEAE